MAQACTMKQGSEQYRYGQLHVVDGFFSDFQRVREWADAAIYEDVVNPVDGVVYPGICADIPEWIRDEVESKLLQMTGRRPAIRHIFLRLSLAGAKAPHQAHTDSTMGAFSLMVYLNRPEDCRGGTALVRHRESGMDDDPRDEHEEALWKRDTNNPQAWDEIMRCSMAANRGCVFPAEKMHRAEPVGGFGTTPRNGRLALTAFFE